MNIVYVVPKPPKGGSKTQSVRYLNNKLRDNSETVRDRMSVTYSITNGKSHTGFRLVPTSMTLNDLERRNSLYFVFFCHRIRQIFRPIISQWLKIDL